MKGTGHSSLEAYEAQAEVDKGKLLIGWAAISTATPYRPDTLRKCYRVPMVDANVLFFRKGEIMDVMVVVNYVKENPAVIYPVLTFLMAFLPIPKKNEKLIALRGALMRILIVGGALAASLLVSGCAVKKVADLPPVDQAVASADYLMDSYNSFRKKFFETWPELTEEQKEW
ncbi:hypothetical protein ADUPG1_001594, partial [Aduncisulcus paluster]